MSDVKPWKLAPDLLKAVDQTTTDLMQICDGSNWPEYAQDGVGYRAYSEITEQLHEIIFSLQHARAALAKATGGA